VFAPDHVLPRLLQSGVPIEWLRWVVGLVSFDVLRRSPLSALLYGAPIGLGGAEFRLPVLAGVFGYPARRAVALNIAISLITVVSALLIRGGTLSLTPLLGLLPVVVAMIAGAVSAAYMGTALVHHVSERLLERAILVLLVVIGTALIVEAFLPHDVPGLLPEALPIRVVAAVFFGLAIGLGRVCKARADTT
jgi:uncharacterized membrane protein YfcA